MKSPRPSVWRTLSQSAERGLTSFIKDGSEEKNGNMTWSSQDKIAQPLGKRPNDVQQPQHWRIVWTELARKIWKRVGTNPQDHEIDQSNLDRWEHQLPTTSKANFHLTRRTDQDCEMNQDPDPASHHRQTEKLSDTFVEHRKTYRALPRHEGHLFS